MMGALEPLWVPLATDGLLGERANGGLYILLIARVEAGWHRSALLFVGDGKMSVLVTRAHVAER